MNPVQHLTNHRVLIASLFLPYTVDFHLSKDKAQNYAKPKLDQPAASVASPNLIATLAAQQNPSARLPPTPGLEDKLFDFRNETPTAPPIQPKSRARHAEEKKKLPALNISQPKDLQRRKSLDTARVFAEASWTIVPCKAGNIGLQNAINSIAPQLENQVWIGTLGMPTETLEDKTRADIKSRFIVEHNCYPVMPPDAEFEGHYEHYCKQVRLHNSVGYNRSNWVNFFVAERWCLSVPAPATPKISFAGIVAQLSLRHAGKPQKQGLSR
jgi:hypothetical protein